MHVIVFVEGVRAFAVSAGASVCVVAAGSGVGVCFFQVLPQGALVSIRRRERAGPCRAPGRGSRPDARTSQIAVELWRSLSNEPIKTARPRPRKCAPIEIGVTRRGWLEQVNPFLERARPANEKPVDEKCDKTTKRRDIHATATQQTRHSGYKTAMENNKRAIHLKLLLTIGIFIYSGTKYARAFLNLYFVRRPFWKKRNKRETQVLSPRFVGHTFGPTRMYRPWACATRGASPTPPKYHHVQHFFGPYYIPFKNHISHIGTCPVAHLLKNLPMSAPPPHRAADLWHFNIIPPHSSSRETQKEKKRKKHWNISMVWNCWGASREYITFLEYSSCGAAGVVGKMSGISFGRGNTVAGGRLTEKCQFISTVRNLLFSGHFIFIRDCDAGAEREEFWVWRVGGKFHLLQPPLRLI